MRHRPLLAAIAGSIVLAACASPAARADWNATVVLDGTRFHRGIVRVDRDAYEPGRYMVVEDDAELGEVLLFDVIARVSDMDIREVLDIHDVWDLYPEEVATVLFLRELTGASYATIATLRSDDRYCWKEIARQYDIDPGRVGQSPRWYELGLRDDWWKEDPDVEHAVLISLLGMEYGYEPVELNRWSRDGLGYSDIAMMLELAWRSGRDPREILDMKMQHEWRWRTVADECGVDLGYLDAKRAYHWHNSDFAGYYPSDTHRYHPNRPNRQHRSRREYHCYSAWIPNPDDGYYRFAYSFDYDFFFPWGRVYYSYWWPTDCWWDRVWWDCYWHDPIYHPIWQHQVHWVPRGRYYDDWQSEPWIIADPPRERDGRRYAEKIIAKYGDSGSVPASWVQTVRRGSDGSSTVTRGERGQGNSTRTGAAPPPRNRGSDSSPPPRSTTSRSGASSGSGSGSGSSSHGSGGGSSSGSGSRKSDRAGSGSGGSHATPPPSRGSSGSAPPRSGGSARSEPPPSSGGSSGHSSGGSDRGGGSSGSGSRKSGRR